MTPDSPFFSIVIPTYNRADLIGKTLTTILEQQFSDFEVIVVDDGSKDNTEEVVAKFPDPRIQYFKKENAERGAARNYGRVKAKGSYINFFDSDDLMYPNHLATARQFIAYHGSPEFFHLGYDFKTPEGVVTKKVDNLDDTIAEKALFNNFLSCNGVFVRADISAQFPFEEDRKLASAEDWELWIRLNARFRLWYSNVITTSVVGHDQRSISTIPAAKVIPRDLLLIDNLKKDPEVIRAFNNHFSRFVAYRYTFIMLSLAQEKKGKEVVSWAAKAFSAYPMILFSTRFLASIKKIVVR